MPEKKRTGPLLTLAKSWERALKAGTGKKKADRRPASPYTIRNYLKSIRLLADHLAGEDHPGTITRISAEDISEWLDALTDTTSSGNALHHYRNIGSFFAWVVSERMLTPGENPMLEVAMPAANDVKRPPLSYAQVEAMLKTCNSRSFEDLRDAAIIRIFADTGMRLGGLVGLVYHPDAPGLDNDGISDVFLDHDPPLLRLRLKGGKSHVVDIAARTARALDRYIRARSQRPHAEEPALWLGRRGPATRTGIQRVVRERAKAAGIPEHVHPHRFRRSMATWHLDEGGSRDALKARAGWTSDQMINVYVSDSRDRLAWKESQQLGVGNRF